MKNIVFIISCALFIGCTSLPKEKENSIEIIKELEWTAVENSILITNPHDFSVRFNLKVNDFFPLNKQDIVDQSKELALQKNISLEKASWMYVSENTFHAVPFSNENWQHQPILFLNSIGGGFCDDRASILADLWRFQGFKSRIVGLKGHIIPEVFANDKWQMYDPDYNVFYCDKNGVVKSVSELETAKTDLLSNCNEAFINPVFSQLNPLSLHNSALYRDEENKKDLTNWHLGYEEISTDFILPANSSLKIIYDQSSNITNLCIILNTNSFGKMQIPLVPINTTGDFTIKTTDTSFHNSNTRLLFPKKKLIHQMDIQNVQTVSSINYLVNPQLSFMKKRNKIEIHATDSLTINTTQSFLKAEILFGKEDLFFHSKINDNYLFLSLISEYNNEEIDEGFLLNKFRVFLDLDSTLNCIEKRRMIQLFNLDLKEIELSKNYKKIKNNYPISVFKIIIASKNQKMEYLKSIIQ